jgi:hypothetical protein
MPSPGDWHEDDWDTFGELRHMDTGVPLFQQAPDPFLDGGDAVELHRRLTRFHAALPFSESERLWLCSIDFPYSTDFAGRVAAIDAEVFNAGIRQRVPGAELIRRWAAWRREADEYAGQGSLREARCLLGQIGEQLLPEGALTRHPSYYREYVEQVRPTLDI